MTDELPWRAYVQRNYRMFDGIDIWLMEKRSSSTYIGLPTDITFTLVEDTAVSSEPTLSLPDGFARAILDALSSHYGAAGDLRTLRRDYDAERARVDKLIEHLARRP